MTIEGHVNETKPQAESTRVAEAHTADEPHGLARYRGRAIRVLHGAYEIAGQGMLLTRALRHWGCDAHCLSYRVDWDGRGGDIYVDLDGVKGNVGKGWTMARTLMRLGPKFDVFHFHFGTSILPRLYDVPLLKAMGKKVVFHFHGCDVRSRAHMLRTHEYSTCTECDPFCRPRRQKRLLDWAARHADATFFSTMDMAESVPGGRHLPLAIDGAPWAAAAQASAPGEAAARDGINGQVVIGHAPTNRLIKGTHHVVRAVAALREEFPKIELRLMEQRPSDQVPAFLGACDIIVDQLGMGWYGLLAIEGMAVGRPVVLHMREDLATVMHDLPVVSADRETLAATLAGLVRDPARRADLGAQGRAFVQRHHDLPVVGRQLLEIYRRILGI